MKKHELIMVVVDKLTKETHFIPMKSTYQATIAKIFMTKFFTLHEMLTTIILYKDTKFTSKFWKNLF